MMTRLQIVYRLRRRVELSRALGGGLFRLVRGAARLWRPAVLPAPLKQPGKREEGGRLDLLLLPDALPPKLLEDLRHLEGARWVCASFSHAVPPQLASAMRCVVSLADVWTDRPAHLAVHDEQHRFWTGLLTACRSDPEAMRALEALRFDLFEAGIALRRFEKMLDRLPLDSVAGLAVCGPPANLGADPLARIAEAVSGRPVTVWHARRPSEPARPAPRPYLGVPARARPAEKSTPRGAARHRPVPGAILSNAGPESRYFAAVSAIMAALERIGPEIPVVTAALGTRMAAIRRGWPLLRLTARLPPPGSGAVAVQALAACLDRAPPPTGTIDAALGSWLRSEDRLSTCEIAESVQKGLADIVAQTGLRRALILPHWSQLASWSAPELRRHGVDILGAPVFSIGGFHASAVGWDLVDRFAAYGTQAVEALSEVGVRPKRIDEVGSLWAAGALGLDEGEARRIADRAVGPLPDNARIVLVATSRIDPDESDWIAETISLAAQSEGWIVIFKPHPSLATAQLAAVRAACAARGNAALEGVRLAPANARTAALVACCEACLTDNSTVGLEAALRGKPLVVMNWANISFPSNDYVAYGIARRSSNRADLDALLSDVLRQQPTTTPDDEVIRQFNAFNDDRAAERIAKLVAAREG
jgi:hypothetical protein